jgi:hypothetical protein
MVSLSWSGSNRWMVTAVRQYMKVNFEGKLHMLVATGVLPARP